jgi:hypothetical protein
MKREQIERLAAEFWERAGVPVTRPRDLEPAVPLATPGSVVRLDDLRPVSVRRWLLRRGIRLPVDTTDRPLDGCIVAYRGWAVIFLAVHLDDARARMILAHELGHFLAHYDWPRRRVLRRLGPGVLPVLDGERPASVAEELAGLLAGVRVGAHVHVMERRFDPASLARTDRAERTASALGCALLAPRAEVLARAAARRLPADAVGWERVLREEFGFPDRWAALYAAGLRPRQVRRFTDSLGL